MVMMCWLLYCVGLFCLIHPSYSQTDVTLTTSKGPIIGLRWNPHPNSLVSYDAFIGIPYGQIPARFQPAVARSSWSSPLKTQSDGPACPQPSMPYSEDCLYINVYTPLNASSTPGRLAVVAFIHGSGFTFTSSSSLFYGPDFIVPYGIVLVTMNYRLGAAGFLTLGSSLAPGNLGLLDSRLALEWIQKEISVFGGDPGQVTLAGHSAGAVMTMFHLMSNTSSALFQRAIAHSGSALATWALVTPAEAVRRSKLLADAVGCKSPNDTQLLTCLQTVNISSIVDNQDIQLPVETIAAGNVFKFVPVIDTSFGQPPFFTDCIEKMLMQAAVRSKPMITGFTADEGMSFVVADTCKIVEANLGSLILWELQGKLSDKQKPALGKIIENQYFPESAEQNKVLDVINLYTDLLFAYPAIDAMKYLSNITYGYVFAYNGGWGPKFPSMEKLHLTGVYHGDDMNYLFYFGQDVGNCSSNQPNLTVRDNLVKWWTGFAKNGIPDTPVTWSPISEGQYLLIDSSLSLVNAPEVEDQHYNFWANLTTTHIDSSALTTDVNIFLVFITLLAIKLKCVL